MRNSRDQCVPPDPAGRDAHEALEGPAEGRLYELTGPRLLTFAAAASFTFALVEDLAE